MSMLGASLDDLDRLSVQLHATGASIDGAGSDTHHAITAVVDQLRDAGTGAVRSAGDNMSAVRNAVERAQAEADGAMWIGQNAEVLRSAYHDFNAAMARAEQATTGYFDELQRALEQLGGETERYLTELATSLDGARASVDSMAGAVEAQRTELDHVMNTGLRLG